jgi:hypothetical protein
MARYLCGKSVLLSDAIALIKRRDDTPTHMLHIDQPESWVEVVTQTTGHAPSPAAVPSRHPQ